MNKSRNIPTQILLTILLSIDHSSRCKLKVYVITHTKEKPSTTNGYFLQNWWMEVKKWAKFEFEYLLLLIFTYSNSKFKVTCTNVDFECQYIRTHTKEKLSEISNITFATLPFYHKKYSNWMAILSTLEFTALGETIRCASKWFILT